jgi:LPXTG-site transpeptidase (sortase) family protein
MTLPKKFAIVGIGITLLGLIGVAPFAYSIIEHRFTSDGDPNSGAKIDLPEQTPATNKPEKIAGKPIRLIIPSLKMDLAVIDGFYDKTTGKWTLDRVNTHFATLSKQPNSEAGNTLIYGHAIAPVFERLHNIKPGANVIIFTDNGHRLVYRYQGNETVDPANTSIFDYKGKPRLTLQTCTGFWFENRQFFYFELIDAR